MLTKGAEGLGLKGTKVQSCKGTEFFAQFCHFDGGEIALVTQQRFTIIVMEFLV